MNVSLIAIIPAAGTGSRAGLSHGLPKQYHLLGGLPMLRHSVNALLSEPRISQVRVAVAAGDERAEQALAGLPRTVWSPCGGPSRADTVLAALRELQAGRDTWVLVHDAARPGLPPGALSRLIDACIMHDAGGLLALPVADTVKRAAADNLVPAPEGAGLGGLDNGACNLPLACVASSLVRDGLWLAQTPQMFRLGVLLEALERFRGDPRITDEASAIELAGGRPLLVRGDRANDKLTWAEDFAWFEAWLAVRQNPGTRGQ